MAVLNVHSLSFCSTYKEFTLKRLFSYLDQGGLFAVVQKTEHLQTRRRPVVLYRQSNLVAQECHYYRSRVDCFTSPLGYPKK